MTPTRSTPAGRAKLRLAALIGPVRRELKGNDERGAPVYEFFTDETSYSDADAVQQTRIASELVASALEEMRRLQADTYEISHIASTLLKRVTDVTHLTIAEAATFCGVSQKTIRNRVRKGLLTLERIPGTRRYGVSTAELSSGWLRVADGRTENRRP